jgi:hypothetical protein
VITYSGVQVYPGSGNGPTPEDIAVAMCRVTRYAGARWCPLAAHSILVAELCYRKSSSLLHWSYGLLHDAHETVTGEGVSFYKLPEMERVEEEIDKLIFPSFGLNAETWGGSKGVVSEADKKAVAVEQEVLQVKGWAAYYEARKGKPAPTFTPAELDLCKTVFGVWTDVRMVSADSDLSKTLVKGFEWLAARDPAAARYTLMESLP